MSRFKPEQGWVEIQNADNVNIGDKIGFESSYSSNNATVTRLEKRLDQICIWAIGWDGLVGENYIYVPMTAYRVYHKPKTKPYDPKQEPWDEGDI